MLDYLSDEEKVELASLYGHVAEHNVLPFHMHEGDLVDANHKDVYWAEDDRECSPANVLMVKLINSGLRLLAELADTKAKLAEAERALECFTVQCEETCPQYPICDCRDAHIARAALSRIRGEKPTD